MGRPYFMPNKHAHGDSYKSSVRQAAFELVWRNRKIQFTCLAVPKRQGWEMHNITPDEAIPSMGRDGLKRFRNILQLALEDVLHGPVWTFPMDLIDWEGWNVR